MSADWVRGAALKERATAVNEALETVERYIGIDGEHHVRWVLDQLLQAVLGTAYLAWVAEYRDQFDENGERYRDYNPGIAP